MSVAYGALLAAYKAGWVEAVTEAGAHHLTTTVLKLGRDDCVGWGVRKSRAAGRAEAESYLASRRWVSTPNARGTS